jgi:hypothetical protein
MEAYGVRHGLLGRSAMGMILHPARHTGSLVCKHNALA